MSYEVIGMSGRVILIMGRVAEGFVGGLVEGSALPL